MRTFAVTDDNLKDLFTGVMPHLDERQRRILAANVALSLGRGGVIAVAEATAMSRSTIQTAINQVDAGIEVTDRVRAPGGGRKPIWDAQPGILQSLDDLVEPDARGCPMSPLRWTSKSVVTLGDELRKHYEVSDSAVYTMLVYLGYSLQALAKENEGTAHPDRNAQFLSVATHTKDHLDAGDPVISVDTKKKELVGNHKNSGSEYQPKGRPQRVDVHDFPDPGAPKAIPYGVYDLGANEGWVTVGDDADTAAFAVNTIDSWWDNVGSILYPDAKRLCITADGGGSNGSKSKLWKRELAAFAQRTGLTITVCHFPPGTSKWNRIEHRLFSHITMNWRGRPLTDHQTVVNLIGATTTKKGLKVRAQLDTNHYPKGIKVPESELKALRDSGRLVAHKQLGDWNYTLNPTVDALCTR